MLIIGYVQSEEIAERWSVSARQVLILYKAGRINGAFKFGNTWAIPEDVAKPIRTGKLKPWHKPKICEDN